MNKPQGIRDDRGSCCEPLTRSLGAMSKVATGNVGSRHSSTGSSNRHHEARSPAHRPSGRLPSSLRTATAARITTVTRAGCGFLNGSAVWLSGGFDTGCSFVAARLNQLRGENVHVLAQPVSGRGRSRAGSTSLRGGSWLSWPARIRKNTPLVSPRNSRVSVTSAPREGLAFQDRQEIRGAP